MPRRCWAGSAGHDEGDNAAAREYLDKIPLVADERKEADRLIARFDLQAGGTANEAALREKVESRAEQYRGSLRAGPGARRDREV